MTIEETKENLSKFCDIKELADKIEDAEDFLENCNESDIDVYVRFSPKNFAYQPIWGKYQKELKEVCLAILKIKLKKDLKEMKEKLSKVDIKIETKD